MESPYISVVVPVLNEEGNVAQLFAEIVAALEKIGKGFEVIFVNDGSTDGTGAVLSGLGGCTVIEMRRTFGQTASLVAGFSQSRGQLIATLDGDLQNDPLDLLKMIDGLEHSDVDLIIGWRKRRNDPFGKKMASRLAYITRQFLLGDGIHDAGCGIKVMKREVVETLELYGEMHRFMASVAKDKGFVVREMEVNHRARPSGKTKYNLSRGIKGFLDMLSVWFWGKYSARPLHLLGGLGLLLVFTGLFTLFVSITHIFTDLGVMQSEQWIIFGFLEIILGVQMIISGFVADIVVRSYYASGKKTSYEVKNITSH